MPLCGWAIVFSEPRAIRYPAVAPETPPGSADHHISTLTIAKPKPAPRPVAGRAPSSAIGSSATLWLDLRRETLLPAGLAVVGLPFARSASTYGPTISAAEARALPEFQPGGRVAFFARDENHYWIYGVRSGLIPHEWALGLMRAQYSPNLKDIQQYVRTYIDSSAFDRGYVGKKQWMSELAVQAGIMDAPSAELVPALEAYKQRCEAFTSGGLIVLDARCVAEAGSS
jgi:hypothetical protein